MTIHTTKKHIFKVVRIMHCVERDEAIGIECSLTLFEAHHMLPDLYIKPSMKLGGQVSLFAVLVQW